MTVTQDKKRFNGEWKKDHQASEPLDNAADLLQLSGMVKGALKKMDRIHIECDGQTFRSKTPMPKLLFWSLGAVEEEFPLNGEERHHKRRDNRDGTFTGKLVSHYDGRLAVQSTWKDPLPGKATDTYSLSPDGNTMTIAAELTVEGKSTKYK